MLFAVCTSFKPLSKLSRLRNAVVRALGVAGQFARVATLPAFTETGPLLPPTSSTLLAALDIAAGNGMEAPAGGTLYAGPIMSATRPAQPVVPKPLGSSVCHCPCWSACEN